MASKSGAVFATGFPSRLRASVTFAMPAVVQNVRDMFKVRPGGPLDTGGPYKVGACNGAVTWATGVAS